eukprot:1221991-Rhodomonas_salina.2
MGRANRLIVGRIVCLLAPVGVPMISRESSSDECHALLNCKHCSIPNFGIGMPSVTAQNRCHPLLATPPPAFRISILPVAGFSIEEEQRDRERKWRTWMGW